MKIVTFPRWRRVVWNAIRAAVLLAGGGWFALRLVPIPAVLTAPLPPSLELTDRHGATLRERRVEERFSREVPFGEIPPSLVRAMLAAEDRRFFAHRGVDVLATLRAVFANVRHARVTSGASTITQQLVKNAAPRPRSLRTKCIEAATALRLEQVWSKERVFAAYVNRIDFGNLNIGVAAAADYYFAKPLADLSDAECAFLSGLPKNPTRLNPHAAFRAAKRRQETVLGRMVRAGWLTAEQHERAAREPLTLRPARRVFRAPHFVDLVLRELPAGMGAGLATTLDLDLNRFVEDAVRARLARLRGQNVRSAAAVVLDNASGDVLALVGSEDYFAPGAGQVNGAWARRSAGSTFKPFTYLLALERGGTPATVVADVPALFATPTGLYRPENYHRRCAGPVSYRQALGSSLNIPAVRVLAGLGGAGALQERLRAWGMTTLDKPADEYGLGLTIGNAEARLLELVNGYATLARMGEWRPYRLSAANAQRSTPNAQRSTDPRTADAAWLIADMLSDNSARARSFGLHSALRFDFPVACKTGTSTDYRDNWAIGYTPEFTVGVWVGNFDGSPMRDVSGVSGAAPIMHDVFEHLHARFGTTWFARPASIVERDVQPLTGRLLAQPRAEGVREKFLRDRLPPLESAADYGADGRVRLGTEYLAWSRSGEGMLAGKATVEPHAHGPQLVSPIAGSTYLLDPDLPSSRRIPLVAHGSGELVWQSPSVECRTVAGGTVAIVGEGEHRLTVRDASGRSAETWIRVKAL